MSGVRAPVTLLYRNLDNDPEEIAAAKASFPVVSLVTHAGDTPGLVIGRYSVLPNYQEVEDNLQYIGCRLVNTYAQHRYIADFDYYEDVKDLTAETFEFGGLSWAMAANGPGGWVVKGATNSKKWRWLDRMYAPTKYEANIRAVALQEDSLIGQQKILVRRYMPLLKLAEGINGLPITNEWRFFYLYGRLVAYGYYWGTHPELADWSEAEPPKAQLLVGGHEVAELAAKRIAPHVNFFAVDVAELDDGTWKVVEVNDGQQAGLSCIPPDRFYRKLREVLG